MHSLLPFAFADGHDDHQLIIIFGFILLLVAIRSVFRLQRQKIWHETARIALDKGQPLPPQPPFRGFGCRGWVWARGLILVALGIGFYLVPNHGVRDWAPLPVCVGVALILIGLITGSRGGGPNNPPPGPPSA